MDVLTVSLQTLDALIKALAVIGGTYSIHQVYRKLTKPKPTFRIDVGHDLTRGASGIVSVFRIENASNVPAHNVRCYVSITNVKTKAEVANNQLLMDVQMLAPKTVKEVKASGTFAKFEPNQQYDLFYSIQCNELEEAWTDHSPLRT